MNDSWFSQAPPLLICGMPGSGRTTFTDMMLYQLLGHERFRNSSSLFPQFEVVGFQTMSHMEIDLSSVSTTEQFHLFFTKAIIERPDWQRKRALLVFHRVHACSYPQLFAQYLPTLFKHFWVWISCHSNHVAPLERTGQCEVWRIPSPTAEDILFHWRYLSSIDELALPYLQFWTQCELSTIPRSWTEMYAQTTRKRLPPSFTADSLESIHISINQWMQFFRQEVIPHVGVKASLSWFIQHLLKSHTIRYSAQLKAWTQLEEQWTMTCGQAAGQRMWVLYCYLFIGWVMQQSPYVRDFLSE